MHLSQTQNLSTNLANYQQLSFLFAAMLHLMLEMCLKDIPFKPEPLGAVHP
jgi:hypothetical protein